MAGPVRAGTGGYPPQLHPQLQLPPVLRVERYLKTRFVLTTTRIVGLLAGLLLDNKRLLGWKRASSHPCVASFQRITFKVYISFRVDSLLSPELTCVYPLLSNP